MQVSATVALAQCSPEQQKKFRACAKSEQQTSVAPYKQIVTIEALPNRGYATGPRQEIQIDPSRQMIIRTLVYY